MFFFFAKQRGHACDNDFLLPSILGTLTGSRELQLAIQFKLLKTKHNAKK